MVTLEEINQISPSFERLQLIDVSGSIDVIIPDLPSTWNINSIYEFQGQEVISNNLTMFAEAFTLPWDLFIAGKDGHSHLTMLPADLLKESMEHYASRNYPECVPNKRYKIDQAFGFMCCSKANVKASLGCKLSAKKVLLEFMLESVYKCELLRIGGYYITKHNDEDMLHSVKGVNDVQSFKLNVGHFPNLADLVTRINYNYFYMSDNNNLITAPVSETVSSKMGKAFAVKTD
ncbi:hypothetical protein LOK49_LG05G03526 [Camellia lanceoleosa]|uniref:Uncharacterized protein n=1 Tax=Camellia lanceoleosa TaxID=1840588 RepID=A0ACC0HR35_9ERIC|nr:hypothetical protein LOK49_LG05G03526 [Camellia lanceoleosa]